MKKLINGFREVIKMVNQFGKPSGILACGSHCKFRVERYLLPVFLFRSPFFPIIRDRFAPFWFALIQKRSGAGRAEAE